MPGHPAAGMHADRCDLAIIDPDARVLLDASAHDVESRQRVDQCLLDLAQVPMQILAMLLEIEDRISNELAGAVKGDVPTALDVEQLDTAGGERCFTQQQMLAF